MHFSIRCLPSALLLVFAVACDESEPSTPGAADATSDATDAVTTVAEVDASSPTVADERFRIRVFGQPQAGVPVRVTRADGSVEEPTTDVDGRFAVAQVAGPLSVVFETDIGGSGTPETRAFVDFEHDDWDSRRGDDGEIALTIYGAPFPLGHGGLQVEGLNPASNTVHFMVAGGLRPGSAYVADPESSLQVTLDFIPESGPVHVVAYEGLDGPTFEAALGWTIATFPTFDEVAEGGATLDFGQRAEVQLSSQYVVVPSNAPVASNVGGLISADWGGQVQVGVAGRASSVAREDLFVVAQQWVEPPDASDYQTMVWLTSGKGTSIAVRPSKPSESKELVLLELPELDHQPDAWSPLVNEPPTITNAPSDARAFLEVLSENDLVVSAEYGHRSRTLVMPRRPGGATPQPRSSLRASIGLIDRVTSSDGLTIERSSTTPTWNLGP